MRYRHQTGPLNVGLRIEEGFAMLATVMSSIHGGTAEMIDFMPNRGFRAEPPEATPDDVLRLLQSLKR